MSHNELESVFYENERFSELKHMWPKTCIVVSYCCCNKFRGLKQHKFILLKFGQQKSQQGSMAQLKISREMHSFWKL